jgi:hypothetical protein
MRTNVGRSVGGTGQVPNEGGAIAAVAEQRLLNAKYLASLWNTLNAPHPGVDYMIHHLLSHNDTPDWLKVNEFFLEQLAYLAKRMDAIREGDRTLLDNTMLMLCSSMRNGQHDASRLPVVMLGGGGGRTKGGQNLDYAKYAACT